jgi:hypothetical protein
MAAGLLPTARSPQELLRDPAQVGNLRWLDDAQVVPGHVHDA